MFSNVSDKLLVMSYFNALELKVEQDFILLLRREIDRRGIKI
ncbi:sporulation histidine kinase inhibitor Sda [Niallia sp. XMNu-256]